jgi:hypothetical protein
MQERCSPIQNQSFQLQTVAILIYLLLISLLTLHSKKQSVNITTPKSYSPRFQKSTKSKILFKSVFNYSIFKKSSITIIMPKSEPRVVGSNLSRSNWFFSNNLLQNRRIDVAFSKTIISDIKRSSLTKIIDFTFPNRVIYGFGL